MSQKTYQLRVLLFKALANDVRLRIVEALTDGEKSVGELCDEIGEHQTRMSHELRCLLVCGFVGYRRDGKRIVYSLNRRTILPILEAADRHASEYGERMKGCDLVSEAKRMKVHELKV